LIGVAAFTWQPNLATGIKPILPGKVHEAGFGRFQGLERPRLISLTQLAGRFMNAFIEANEPKIDEGIFEHTRNGQHALKNRCSFR